MARGLWQWLGRDETGSWRGKGRCRKIIVFREGCCADEQAVARLGGRPVKPLPLVNAVVADFPKEAEYRVMAEMPHVARVDDDLEIRAVGVGLRRWTDVWPALGRLMPSCWRRRQPEPAQSVPWGVAAVRAPEAWSTSRGGGVKVAVMDTGIDLRHPDLRDRVAGGYNALSPGRDPMDDNGHGTHVAGIIAATDNAAGVVGVAPQALLCAVKVLDAYGAGFLSDLIEGLDWCVREGVQVVNMSLGTREGNDTFHEAVRRAYQAGVLLVAAAGNDGASGGADTVNYPARYAETIAVSAVDRQFRLPRFASRGPSVDIVAPGVDVLSTWPGGSYRALSGTSMATPHVSGVAALALAARPGWKPDAVRGLLVTRARRLAGVPYPLVDAARAVAP